MNPAAGRARAGDLGTAAAARPLQAAQAARALLAYGARPAARLRRAADLRPRAAPVRGGSGLSLALVGAVLLAARIVDAVTDPLIGWANDRLPRRRLWVALALPALGAGHVRPADPARGGGGGVAVRACWSAVSLAYSVATIAYNAWGAEVAATPAARTRFVASREAFALAGVVLAAALPGLLGDGEGVAVGPVGGAGSAGRGPVGGAVLGGRRERRGGAAGLARLAWVLPAAAGGLRPVDPAGGRPHRRAGRAARAPMWPGLRAALARPGFARLLAVFAANGIAAAIPSATVLFFVADVLQAEAFAGAFLALYFLAAAAGACRYGRELSQRVGKLRAWLAGMALAVAVFAWAGLLGSGDLLAYACICVLSGVALGADLTLPPSLLADLLARGESGRFAARGGAARGGGCTSRGTHARTAPPCARSRRAPVSAGGASSPRPTWRSPPASRCRCSRCSAIRRARARPRRSAALAGGVRLRAGSAEARGDRAAVALAAVIEPGAEDLPPSSRCAPVQRSPRRAGLGVHRRDAGRDGCGAGATARRGWIWLEEGKMKRFSDAWWLCWGSGAAA